MSGFIENTIEPLFNKWISKFKMFGFMNGQTVQDVIERKTAAQHVWMMFALSMVVNYIAMFSSWAYLGYVGLVALIAIAEWGPKGRWVDVVTRGFGVVLGEVFQLGATFIAWIF